MGNLSGCLEREMRDLRHRKHEEEEAARQDECSSSATDYDP